MEKWSNFIIRALKYFNKNGQRWVTLPSEKVEKNGEIKYFAHCFFEEKETAEEFRSAVLKLVDEELRKTQVEEFNSNELPF